MKQALCFVGKALYGAQGLCVLFFWLHLVRKLLKRGNFTSLDDLRDQILAFIDSYNRRMAKPIKWTYTGIV